MTLEQLTELVETLQGKINELDPLKEEVTRLEATVKQYRKDIRDLEIQLSQSITTDQLTVVDTAKVAGQDIKGDREQIQNNANNISVNKSSISANKSDISTNKSAITSAKDELKGELSQVVDGTTELKQLNVASNQLPQNPDVDIINNDRHAVIGAHDLWFGHSVRKGEPGRAIVDRGDRGLVINYFDNLDPGWPFVEIRKELKVQGGNGNLRVQGEIIVNGDIQTVDPEISLRKTARRIEEVSNQLKSLEQRIGGFSFSPEKNFYIFPTVDGTVHLGGGGTCFYHKNGHTWCHKS